MTDKLKWSVKSTGVFIEPVIFSKTFLMEMEFELMTWDRIIKYCLRCALRYESAVYRGELRVFLLFFRKF